MLVDKHGAVLWCLEWSSHKSRGFRLRSKPRQCWYVASLLEVLMTIVEMCRDSGRVRIVAIESLYLPPKKNRAFLRCIESRGVLGESVGLLKPDVLLEPTPLQWRKAVLGVGVRNRKQAKKLALTAVRKVPSITLPQSDHVAEAYCIAEFGRRYVR